MTDEKVRQQRQQVKADRRSVRKAHDKRHALRRDLRHQTAVFKRREARLHKSTAELRALKNVGAKAAVEWGLEQAKTGRVESPAFSNSSPWMDSEFSKYGFHPGYSWCQYMADSIVTHGGGQLIPSGYTVAVVQYAHDHKYGLSLIAGTLPTPSRVSTAALQIGDLYYMKWPGVSSDFCDHVGVYAGDGKGLEGNTSPGTGGSQNNGGGLYLRTIAERAPYIVAIVRPTYTTV